MTAEAWNDQRVELTIDELMEACVDMSRLLDQTVALIRAYRESGDERLLDILLDMIGNEEDLLEEDGEEDGD